MENKKNTLTEEIRLSILNKFKEGKLVSEIIKEIGITRAEAKDVIEDYLNCKLLTEDKVV